MTSADWYDEAQTYWCALCNNEIQPEGFDPVLVYVEASRVPDGSGGAWSFHAHALCVRDSFDPGYGRDIPREIYMPAKGSSGDIG